MNSNDVKPRRVFIVGSPRSGTTLLQSLLAAHKDVQGFAESHFFDKGFKRQFGLSPWRLQPELARRVDRFFADNPVTSFMTADELMGGLTGDAVMDVRRLASLFDQSAELQNKTVWLEKTPDNVRRIRLIRAALPDAVFIHIFRLPVSTILSLRKAKLQWGGNNSWLRCFAHWYTAMRCSASWIGSPGHFFIAYELLTEFPEQILQELTEWLKLPPDEDVLAKRVDATASLVRRHEVWKANNFSEIRHREPPSDAELPLWLRHVLRNSRVYEKLLSASKACLSHIPNSIPVYQTPAVGVSGAAIERAV